MEEYNQFMTLDENKHLTLTEDELVYVKRANCQASPTNAAMFLLNYLKNNNLEEDLEHKEHDVRFYTECMLAYRRKNFEVK
jgi:hypothetical protein